MLYEGSKLSVALTDGIAELTFDATDDSVNKFDAATVRELGEAADALTKTNGLKGLLVYSRKPMFIVGADITEFGEMFKQSDADLIQQMLDYNKVFNTIEDLGVPSVVAINGMALGGGFEMSLAVDYRVMGKSAKVGFPETSLGIYPGFGGTVRFPRLVGADNAMDWIANANQNKAKDALKIGAVDAVVADEQVVEAGRDLLNKAIAGDFDWRARNAQKKTALVLNKTEAAMSFDSAKGLVAQKAGPNYPAPMEAVQRIEAAAGMTRDDALKEEGEGFAKIAKTPQADALIGLFLNDQLIKSKTKRYSKIAHAVNQAAVLGAGIMGGGIAYQSALKGVPIRMKDIKEDAIQLGLDEAAKHFDKRVSKGKMTTSAMAQGMGRIRPTLSYADFGDVDVVVEAVVENPKIKKSVHAEVEDAVSDNTIIATNTSSISIDDLAANVKRPANFLGMHFFNPVHAMPLVEIIRGEKTSDEAVATIVSYASQMGKTPIVVNNCPGFLVNRILFPYFFGFQSLISSGVDFAAIDKVMEKFGWPMGPAYLSDVVGIETAQHVEEVLGEGYPDRMAPEGKSSLDVMVDEGRYGQKTGSGYYKYEQDKKGRPKKTRDETAYELVAKVQSNGTREASEDEIVERMMIPMIIEAARCLEEDIVGTPNELDMGLVLGLGFPMFRGGALRYADSLGISHIVERADAYSELGKLYEPTQRMREMARDGESYYS